MDNTGQAKLRKIHTHWTAVAATEQDEQGLRPTARDPYLQLLVEDAIESRIHRNAKILDIGCGDGGSTLRFAKQAGKTVGIDYVDSFVNRARQAAEENKITDVCFEKGDILNLASIRDKYGLFDTVITIRCLINLPSWNLQKQAIKQVAEVLRPGGFYFVSEGWLEGQAKLNEYRRTIGLEPLRTVAYNRLISRATFEKQATKYFKILDRVDMGFYAFMSRVYQPACLHPAAPTHTHPINRTACDLYAAGIGRTSFNECDYFGPYVLQKRGE